MANDAVQIKLTLENEKLTKQLRDTERKFARLEQSAKKSSKGMADAFTAAFSRIVVPAAVIGGITQLGQVVIQTSKAVADLNDAAASLGVSFKNFQVLQYAATQSGVGIEKLTASMGKLQAVLGQVASGEAKNAADVLAQLGLNINDLLAKSPDEQFAAVAQALAGIENPAQRAAAGVALFGKGFRELNPLINQGEKSLADWAKEAEDAGVIIDDLTRDKMAKFDDSMERLGLQIDATKANALSPFVDFLNQQFAVAMDNNISRTEKFITLFRNLSPGGLLRGVLGTNESKPLPSVAGKESRDQAAEAARAAASAAYDAEQAEFRKFNAKLAADDEKRKANAAKVGASVGKVRAIAEIDTYKSTLAEAQQELNDAQNKLLAFETAGEQGLESVERQIELREKIARLVGKETNPERIKALTEIAEAEAAIADALQLQIDKQKELDKANAEAAEKRQQDAIKTREAWEKIAITISDALAGVITGAKSAKDAVLELVEAILQAIVKAAILAAFGQGSFGSNLKSGFGFPTGASAAGPTGATIRVYNYSQAPGGVMARQSSDGSVDIMIGQIAKAISTGGNQLDNTLRRTYGMKRIGV